MHFNNKHFVIRLLRPRLPYKTVDGIKDVYKKRSDPFTEKIQAYETT